MTVSKINSYCYSVDVIASLKKNERLQTNGRKLSKLSSPDRFFKTSTNPLLQLVHRIVTAAMRIIQALVRYFKNEYSALNLLKVESLANEMKELVTGSVPDQSDEEFYPTLKSLGHIRHGLHKSVQSGLSNYRDTILFGEAEFVSEPYIERALKADRIDGLITKFSDEIVPQIERIISQMEDEVYERDLERFNQFLTSISNNDEVELTIQFSSKAVFEILNKRYGSKVIERVRRYYDLENHLTISGNDGVALIIGAKVNLTAEDYFEVNPDAQYRDEEEIIQQLMNFRHPINEKYLISSSKKRYQQQLNHDQHVLKNLNSLEDWKGETDQTLVRGLKKFSYAEYLARHIVYALLIGKGTQFSDGMLIPLYDRTNTLRLHSAYKIVDESGLHGILLKPLHLNEEQDNNVYVVFRGSHCKDSIFRDLSPTESMYKHFFDGPGRYSFSLHQDSIYQKILSLIHEIPNVTLEFIGHSLGASDAMRALEYVLYQEAQDQKLDNVQNLELSVFNTPAIEPDIARRFMVSLNTLPIETNLRYFDVHYDLVQELGSTRLGYLPSNQTYPDQIKISVFKFNRRIEERVIALAKNIFKRLQFFIGKSLEAHTFNCLRLHDTDDLTKINSTFIQNIITNHPADVGVQYGNSLQQTSTLSSDDELNDVLLTNLCLEGRKIKRIVLYVKKSVCQFFSFIPGLTT